MRYRLALRDDHFSFISIPSYEPGSLRLVKKFTAAVDTCSA